jgi:hypothetical protein
VARPPSWTLPWLWCGLLAGCAENGPGAASPGAATFEPTEPILLSTGSPTKDEDPSVLRARDGSLYVAWFSDRGGNPDIYLTRTGDGKGWSAPVRVTAHAGGDFNPSLIQDEQGTFHLAWFRWTALFRGHIYYNSSADGLSWDALNEVQVTTTAGVDDWVPTLTRAADGTLLVYFVSALRGAPGGTSDLYLAARRPGSNAWDAAVPVTALNSATAHDHLPFAARTGGDITLVWVRHDTSEPLPWLNTKSDTYAAVSADGRSWSSPAPVTRELGRVVNLFPALYARSDGQWSLVWLSTRQGAPKVFDLPVSSAGRYPEGVAENPALPAGYSHRVAATTTAGVYLGVWVQGPEGSQDVYYRFFKR